MLKSYFITDPSICGDTPAAIQKSLALIIEKHAPDYICLRDKKSDNYEALAKAFLSLKGEHMTLLHSDLDLAIALGADGIHLTSAQYSEIDRAKAAGLYVIASTHSYEEALKAKRADAITYSPIFASPNKGKPKGLGDLKEIVGKININIFALGGIISSEQVEQVESTDAYGFASIRYFTL